MHKRNMVCLLAGAFALMPVLAMADADDYPQRPVYRDAPAYREAPRYSGSSSNHDFCRRADHESDALRERLSHERDAPDIRDIRARLHQLHEQMEGAGCPER